MRIIEPLVAGNIYHIYNRGINDESIFKEKSNYYYFLDKYEKYCSRILDTYAYILMKNHFHILVKVNENIIEKAPDGKADLTLTASRQLSHFFNCYAQSINKAYHRHGSLFEKPFRRQQVDCAEDIFALIYYIHFTPQQNRIVDDFRKWEFSSWHSLSENWHTFLANEKVMEWFGSIKLFKEAHLHNIPANMFYQL